MDWSAHNVNGGGLLSEHGAEQPNSAWYPPPAAPWPQPPVPRRGFGAGNWFSAGFALIGVGLLTAAAVIFAVRAAPPIPVAPEPPPPGPVRIATPRLAGLAVAADGRRVYLAYKYDDVVAIFDPAVNAVTGFIAVPGEPQGLTLSPDGSRLFVLTGKAVAIVDTKANKVIGHVIREVGAYAGAVAANRDGRRAYVSDGNRPTLTVIDGEARTTVTVVPLRSKPDGFAPSVALAPDGRTAYVAHSDQISVFDTATNTVRAEVPTRGVPERMTPTPDGRTLYLSGFGDVRVLDTVTNAITELKVKGIGREAAVAPGGRYVFIVGKGYTFDGGGGFVKVLDRSSGAEVETLKFPMDLDLIAIAPDGRRAYVGNSQDGGLMVADISRYAK